jgi:hypothetical protein
MDGPADDPGAAQPDVDELVASGPRQQPGRIGDQAAELHSELQQTFERLVGSEHRFADRKDPKLRPPDALPMEFVLLGYPILDAPPLPDDDEAAEDAASGQDPAAHS